MERDSFVFYRSFFDAAEKLKDDPGRRLELYEAIIKYALNGDPETTDETILMALELCRTTIDKNNAKYINAKKGGRPKNEELEADKSDFERFWKVYPRKQSKKAAAAAFEKVDVPVEKLIEYVEIEINTEEWKKEGGRFIPYAASWLKNERWLDLPDV